MRRFRQGLCVNMCMQRIGDIPLVPHVLQPILTGKVYRVMTMHTEKQRHPVADDNFFTNLMNKFFILIHLLRSSTFEYLNKGRPT